MHPSVSKSDRCACGRPAVTTVCCLLCPDGHSRFCNEVLSPPVGSIAAAIERADQWPASPAQRKALLGAVVPSALPSSDVIGVVLDFQGSRFSCGHCGAEEALVLPISVTVLVERSDAFLEQHEGCHLKTGYRPGAVTDASSNTEVPRSPEYPAQKMSLGDTAAETVSMSEDAGGQSSRLPTPGDLGTSAVEAEPLKCAAFAPEAIPADVRAQMDADRKAAELAAHACAQCRAGDHQRHQPQFGGICIGCTCPWRAEG